MKQLAAATLTLSLLSSVVAAEADLQISRAGTRVVNAAPAQNFTGSVTVEVLYVPAGPDRASAGSVTFSAGARTAWHTHPLGQTLVVTAGVGRVQRWGGPVEEIRAGRQATISDGVVGRRQIAAVLVRSLTSTAARGKTFELVAERGAQQEDFEALFGALQSDGPSALDAGPRSGQHAAESGAESGPPGPGATEPPTR